jgi:hypothetical protein
MVSWLAAVSLVVCCGALSAVWDPDGNAVLNPYRADGLFPILDFRVNWGRGYSFVSGVNYTLALAPDYYGCSFNTSDVDFTGMILVASISTGTCYLGTKSLNAFKTGAVAALFPDADPFTVLEVDDFYDAALKAQYKVRRRALGWSTALTRTLRCRSLGRTTRSPTSRSMRA